MPSPPAGNIPLKFYKPTYTTGDAGQTITVWTFLYTIYAERRPIGGQVETADEQRITVEYDAWRIRTPGGPDQPEGGWRVVTHDGKQHLIDNAVPFMRGVYTDLRTVQDADPEDVT